MMPVAAGTGASWPPVLVSWQELPNSIRSTIAESANPVRIRPDSRRKTDPDIGAAGGMPIACGWARGRGQMSGAMGTFMVLS